MEIIICCPLVLSIVAIFGIIYLFFGILVSPVAVYYLIKHQKIQKKEKEITNMSL